VLKAGDRIPNFDLVTDRGERVSPQALKGARTVLFFYPKDDTPTCTQEACAFRDALPKFTLSGVRVFGISADDEKRHGRFAAKYGLNYPLIADPGRQAIEGFGVWIEKQLYGRKYMGIARTTFAIDASGRIEKVWNQVKATIHAEEVLAWVNGEEFVAQAPAAKRSVVKPGARPAPGQQAAAKKPAVKKAAAKKVVVKKVVARKVAAKKVAAKKHVRGKAAKR
jgi:peroxiredoxin Q/BCP